MDEIVDLKRGVVGLVREAVKEAGHVEEPDRRPLHDVQTKDGDGAEVDGLVHLLDEFGLPGRVRDAPAAGDGASEVLTDEVACCE